jgi:transcriptional regulator with XRE-family HTH domain
MMLIGTIAKHGSWWAADIEAAGIHTQGKTKAEAHAMLVDAVRELADRPGLRVTVTALDVGRVLVEASEPAVLAQLVLRYQRSVNRMSLADVATKLKAKSRNAYARIEQGGAVPRVDTLVELLGVVAPGIALAFIERPVK